jgi:hypothetical protein
MNVDVKQVFVPVTDAPPAPMQPLGACEVPVHAHAKLDRLGIWLSAVCAVHCAIVPVAQIFFPVLMMMKWMQRSRTMDIVTIGVAAVFGLGGCILSLRHHRNLLPLCLVMAGLLLNVVARIGWNYFGPYLTPSLLVAGALVMVYGLSRDRRLCRCSCRAH